MHDYEFCPQKVRPVAENYRMNIEFYPSPTQPSVTHPVFVVLSSSAKYAYLPSWIGQYGLPTYDSPFCRLLKECQGIIAATPYALEETSINTAKSFWGEKKKEMYVVGPLLAPEPDPTTSKSSGDIENFLADKLQRFGEKSVLYVWPLFPLHQPGKLTAHNFRSHLVRRSGP